MSHLQQAVVDYLSLRRAMGFKLERAGMLLPDFAAFLEREGAGYITCALAVRWASQESRASARWGAQRLLIVRLFAKYLSGIDPRTEIPPAELLPYRQQRQAPYLYSDDDVVALLAATRRIRLAFKVHTYTTLFGLLAATGMRVGEAIALEREDADWQAGALVVRGAKFGKSRLVFLHDSTVSALREYAAVRDRRWPTPRSARFLVSVSGRPLNYKNVHAVFLDLLGWSGLAERTSPRRPRIHDLRHSFAVKTLQDWYRAGLDVEARIPHLATYLGHVCPSQTYWYLTATPELLASAAGRLEQHWEQR